MHVISVALEQSSLAFGQFNVSVDDDKYIRHDNGPATMLMPQGPPLTVRVGHDNPNGTARIHGRTPLRLYFQAHYTRGDTVYIRVHAPDRLELLPTPPRAE